MDTETLTAAQSVAWFFVGIGSMVPFILIKIAMRLSNRAMGETLHD